MVYVDTTPKPFGRMLMNHMIADSHEELMAMVDKIGIARKWIQFAGTWKEHFDICQSKRALALSAGAKAIGKRELGQIVRARRTA